MRELLLYHWHCILPVVGIIAAMIFMRDKDKNRRQKDKKNNKEIQEEGE